MSIKVVIDYLSIGGNRNSAASDYDADSGCLAYGADNNVALWHPLNLNSYGVSQILQGHNDKVTAVAFACKKTLISGDADGQVFVWSLKDAYPATIVSQIKAHEGSINVISNLLASDFIVTGGADATINIWQLRDEGLDAINTIKPKPRLIPLSLAAGKFHDCDAGSGFFVAAAGTRNEIQVYAISPDTSSATIACSLTGHEGWVRCLALRKTLSGYLLASTSADKYARLWKFAREHASPNTDGPSHKDVTGFEQTLTAKVKTVSIGEHKYHITFEALLLGHEDWVYSADWRHGEEDKLLTSSADGTLAIWESDPTSGIWVSETRLGEISGQKGATTATGSSGGFWTGKWIDDSTVVSLGRTGSWRKWVYDADAMFWNLESGIGGHTDSVNGLCWSPRGEYLLTTSSDQTTRLHTEWRRNGKRTWHEFSRSQIHGYNCNVVTCSSSSQFISGADEKLLRVFNEPKELADTLQRLCNIAIPLNTTLPETAAIPVLGLSNKEIGEPDDIIEAGPRKGDDDYAAANALLDLSLKDITGPPTEDLLSRHTLWPEYEKLYGHGYEISDAAILAPPLGHNILATACKASSIEHATIRLYDLDNDWRQIEPPLASHTLTVTRLAWSCRQDGYLLSVGRDRQWTVFKFEEGSKSPQLFQKMPKAHTRMILDAVFSTLPSFPFFVTAGRDKTVKVWGLDACFNENEKKDEFSLYATITRPSPVTAVDIIVAHERMIVVLAVGEESGALSLHFLDLSNLQLKESREIDKSFHLSKAVNRLSWRKEAILWMQDSPGIPLAIAGDDGSVRILRLEPT